MNEKKITLVLTSEEGDWLQWDEGFFNKKIKSILDEENWRKYNPNEPYINKLDIAKDGLLLLLEEMKRIMVKYPPNNMDKYKQTTDYVEIDEKLDGADYRLAESISLKIKKIDNQILL